MLGYLFQEANSELQRSDYVHGQKSEHIILLSQMGAIVLFVFETSFANENGKYTDTSLG